MERLWAPWRMEYILGENKPEGCVFCSFARPPEEGRAAERAREDLVLAVEEHAFVCLNRYPFTAGHTMVVPRRHVADPSELSDVENAALFGLVRHAVAATRAALRCEGLNVGMNLGKVAGAGIADHLHVHVVPRWGGDTNFMPVLADVRVMPQHLDETWQRLAPQFVSPERAKGTP